jgi:hypothetical protein
MPAGARDFSLIQIVQRGCGANKASNLKGTRSFYPYRFYIHFDCTKIEQLYGVEFYSTS